MSTEPDRERDDGIDPTLIDEFLRMTPRERVEHNDQVLRTLEKLESGLAEPKRTDRPA